MKQVNVAIMGLGTVGFGTYNILVNNKENIKKNQGIEFNVKKVLDKNAEALIKKGVPKNIISTDLNEIISDDSISIVVETIGGIEPAKTFILSVLKSGKSVVTANKELVSKHWAELEETAKKHNAGLYFEASCVGGVPIIRTLTESMQGDNIQEIMGIINGTTNYILTKMTEEGSSYEDALKQAQNLGFAEFDPTADVGGYDAMYKLSILSSLAFHTCIPYTEVYREGITKLTKRDILTAKDLGYTLKLLAIGRKDGNNVEVRVHPTFVNNEHPLASVRNEFNAVFLKGDSVDNIMLYGRGAGAAPTGSAIVSDIVFCAKKEGKHLYTDFENNAKVAKDINIMSDFTSKYYVSLTVKDKAGVLAKITDILGKNNVSISTMLQNGLKKNKDVDGACLVFMTHDTSEKAFQAAIRGLRELDEVFAVDSLIRVI